MNPLVEIEVFGAQFDNKKVQTTANREFYFNFLNSIF